MKSYSRFHLADSTLLRDLVASTARVCDATADHLADIGEVDARKLYVPAGYPSMYAYCVGELRLSEDTAYKRIRVARTAREFPALFAALADGRLNLSSVLMLTPYLAPDTHEELLAAATHKTNTEIERLLAERFPRPDLPARVQPMPATTCTDELAVRPVEALTEQLSPGAESSAPVPRPRMTPLSPERFALQATIGQGTHDKLRYAQALLGHAIPSGDLVAVLDRALDVLIEKLERRKFAASSRSAPCQRHRDPAGRYVPADVRRTVWQRDGGQCTFVSESGHRCPASARLEFDHVDPVARGGEATVDGMRLRCRAHNQCATRQGWSGGREAIAVAT